MMNKITLLLAAMFVLSTGVFASSGSKTSDLTQKTSSPVINIKIDLGDITNLNESEIASLISKNLDSCVPDTPKLQCSVTVGASFTIGIASFTISVTVSGDCSEIRAEGSEIANQLLNDAKRYILRHFN